MGWFLSGNDRPVELLPGVFPPEMSEFDGTTGRVADSITSSDSTDFFIPNGSRQVIEVVNSDVEFGPELTDRPWEMGVRRSEPGTAEFRDQPPSPSCMDREMFWISDLDRVNHFPMSTDIGFGQAHRKEGRMGYEHSGILTLEFRKCGFEREKVGNGFLQPEGQHVTTIPPWSRENFPSRIDGEIGV